MNRFYCSSADVSGDTITIRDRDQVHHIKDVIRLQEGERVFVFDDRAHEFDCVVHRIGGTQVVFAIKARVGARRTMHPEITIACAIPKHSKIDDIIDTLTQLGVDRIIPLLTERVIVRIDREKKKERRLRWQKIALTASKQSQRNTVAAVSEVTDIQDLIMNCREYDLKLIPTLAGDRRTLKEVLSGPMPQKVLILIGPEGDFTSDEVGQAVRAGFTPVSFGDFVFRVETACAYIASILQYAFE